MIFRVFNFTAINLERDVSERNLYVPKKEKKVHRSVLYSITKKLKKFIFTKSKYSKVQYWIQVIFFPGFNFTVINLRWSVIQVKEIYTFVEKKKEKEIGENVGYFVGWTELAR